MAKAMEYKTREFFFAHEFSGANLKRLRKTINQAFKQTPFSAKYPDKETIVSKGPLLSRIEEYILSTEFGIYDICSGKKGLGGINPNVVLELGIAIGANKDCYIIVKKSKAAKIFNKQLSDLAGFDRIQYSDLDDLERQIKDRIIPKYVPEKEFRIFWSSFINEGGTLIVGSQVQKLDKYTYRDIIGEYDDIATSELRSFLFSIAKSSVVKSQKLNIKHLPMPMSVNPTAAPKALGKYVTSIKNSIINSEDRNFVLIGTPTVNPATEIVMSEIFGVEPFNPETRKAMIVGYIINDPRRKSESAFYEADLKKEKGIWNVATKRKALFDDKEGKSCGIIIHKRLWGKDILILSGFNGIATVGAVRMLTSQKEDVDFINRNKEKREFENGFLYDVEFKSVPETNKPVQLELKSVSVRK